MRAAVLRGAGTGRRQLRALALIFVCAALALLQARVASADPLNPVVVESVSDDVVFSPNGDGQLDTASVRFWLSEPVTATVLVTDAAGGVVRSLLVDQPGTDRVDVVWDGLDDFGVLVADGVYEVGLEAVDAQGDVASASVRLGVIQQVPGVVSSPVDGATVSGNVELVFTPNPGFEIQWVEIWGPAFGGPVYGYTESVSADGLWRVSADVGNAVDGPTTLGAFIGWVDQFGHSHFYQTPAIDVTVDNASANPVVVESVSDDVVFSPNGDGQLDTASVRFWLSEPVTATVLVTDAAGGVVRSLLVDQPGTDRVDVVWDGLDDFGVLVADGVYEVGLEAVDAQGDVASASVRLGVIQQVPGVVSSPVDGATVSGNVEFVFTPNPGFEIQWVEFYGPAYGFTESVSADGLWRVSADVGNAVDGPTTLGAFIGWVDQFGHSHFYQTPAIDVTVDNASANPVVVESVSDDVVFSPNGDGQLDTASVRFWLSEPVTATVLVTDAAGGVVRSLLVDQPGTDRVDVVWDGLDDFGVLVADGVYEVGLEAVDAQGDVASASVRLGVIQQVPGVVSSPVDGATVSGNVEFVFTPNPGFEIQWVEFYGPAYGFTESVSADGLWRVSADVGNAVDGPTTLGAFIGWVDQFGQTQYYETPAIDVTVDNASANPVVVESVSDDVVFSPNGDGQLDTASVRFWLSEPVTATVLVTDAAGGVVRSLLVDQPGTDRVDVVWDGLDDFGVLVADGVYEVGLEAVDAQGDVASASVRLGVIQQVPGVVSSPVDGATVSGNVEFVFTPNPGFEIQWVEFYGPAYGFTESVSADGLWRVSADVGNAVDGPTTLGAFIGWVDQFGQTQYYETPSIDVTVDNSEPSASLTSVETGGPAPHTATFVVNASDPDNLPLTYSVSFGDGTPAVSGQVFAPYGAVEVVHEFLSQGTYVASLTVADAALNTASDSHAVSVTAPAINTPPELVLSVDSSTGAAPFLIAASLQATDEDGDDLQYTVDFGDGSDPAVGINPVAPITHTYASPGLYLIRAEVSDGQQSKSALARITVVLPEPLVANAGDDQSTIVDATVNFSAIASRPLDLIDTLQWSFGDGASAEGIAVSHSFTEAGLYQVTLTATSGTVTSVDTVTVDVQAEPTVPGLRVTVQDGDALLSGADVFVTLADGSLASEATDAMGEAVLHGIPDGDVTVFVWASGYSPQEVQASMVDGSGALIVQMYSGEVGAATIETRRLEIEEIEDLGIDINDPANLNIYEAEVSLFFELPSDDPDEPPLMIEEPDLRIGISKEGAFCVTDCGASSFGNLTVTPCGEGPLGLVPCLQSSEHVFVPQVLVIEEQPLLQWLVIPLRASFLKEFFEVKLIVSNLTSGFTFANGEAQLTLPAGLSLAPTSSPQSLVTSVPDIEGGGSRPVTWVVRGDVEGEYDVSAAFTGVVEPIGRTVRLEAKNAQPIEVLGASKLLLVVEVEDRIWREAPYYVTVSLENESEVPVYNASVQIFEPPEDAPADQAPFWIVGPDTASAAVVTSENPLEFTFTVIPQIGNDENPELVLVTEESFIGQTGGNVTLRTDLRDVPAVPKADADVALDPTSRNVVVDWEAVPGAIEYEVFSAENFEAGLGSEAVKTTTETEWTFTPANGERADFLYLVATTLADGSQVFRHVVGARPPRVAILGDSYISGEGTADYIVEPGGLISECHRSDKSWAYLVANDLGAFGDDVIFVACSGATARQMVGGDNEQPDQIAGLVSGINESGLVDLVLVSAGGNDSQFSELLKRCVYPWPWPSCQMSEDFRSLAANDVQTPVAALVHAIRDEVQGAEVFVAGYPRVVDPDESTTLDIDLFATPELMAICPGLRTSLEEIVRGDAVPKNLGEAGLLVLDQMSTIGPGEQTWLRDVFQPTLNNSVRSGAEAQGATYMVNWDALEGHTICSGDPWINGILNGLTTDIPQIAARESAHPTIEGYAAMAAEILDNYGFRLRRPNFDIPLGPEPEPLGVDISPLVNMFVAAGNVSVDSNAPAERPVFNSDQAGSVVVTGVGPNSNVDVFTASSVVTKVGDGVANQDGSAVVNFVVPASFPPGVHVLYARQDDDQVVATSIYEVAASADCQLSDDSTLDQDGDGLPDLCDRYPDDGPLGDFDADGVENRFDVCPQTPDPEQQDQNADGIGDLCSFGTISSELSSVRTFDELNAPVAPVAVDDTASTDEDVPVEIDVLVNDSDVDSDLDVGSVGVSVEPVSGSVVALDTGALLYVPDPDFFGSDSFAYEVCDVDGLCASAQVSMSVAAVNDGPVAVDDTASTDEDVPVEIDVLVNDSDIDSAIDAGSLAVTSVPGDGSAEILDTGLVRYVPGADFFGSDSFTYEVCDVEGLCDTAEVAVTVAPVNDGPVAVDDTASTDEDAPVEIDVLVNDSDIDSAIDAGSLAVTSVPGDGSAEILDTGLVRYVPGADFFGSDSFTYEVCDVEGLCDTAEVAVTVAAVNDGPVAVDDTASTDEDVPVEIDVLVNDSDIDSALDPGSLAVTSVPGDGSAEILDTGLVRYVPGADFFGSDSFTYEVCDVEGLCDAAEVAVTVASVNDAPVVVDDTASTDEDVPVDLDVLANDSDVDSDLDVGSLAVTSVPGDGSAEILDTGLVRYVPGADFFGSDSFTYEVCDVEGLCDTGEVSVTVAPVNDGPVAVDDTASTDEDVPVEIDVLVNDSDIDSAIDAGSLAVTSVPGDGSAEILDLGALRYVPDPDFFGSDSFTYEVCDAEGLCDTAEVTVTVAPVNDGPVAVDDTASTDEDVPVEIDVLVNDSDIDSALDPGSLAITSVPSDGSAEILDTGLVRYVPGADFFGSASFTYEVCDVEGLCDAAEVTVTVAPVNDAPEAADDEALVVRGASVLVDVLANDTDVEDAQLFIADFENPGNGSLTLTDGGLEYTPNDQFCGQDSFAYSASDTEQAESRATATIFVECFYEIVGTVRQEGANGVAVSATVTLFERASEEDPFSAVPGGTTTTTDDGRFKWAVKPGFYRVDAVVEGCNSGNGRATYGSATARVTNNSVEVVLEVDCNSAPTIAPPDPIVVEAPFQADQLVAPVIDDADGDPLTLTNNAPATFPLGTTELRWTVSDPSGETAIAVQEVTVEDTVAPELTVPNSIVVSTFDAAGAAVSFEVTAEDAFEGTLSAECTFASGGIFPIGTSAVDCSARDGSGNSTSATFSVEVVLEASVTLPVANDDVFQTDEDSPVTGNVLTDNGFGADIAPVDTVLTVVAVDENEDGLSAPFTLPSGAILTLNATGEFSYLPAESVNALGASDDTSDRFTYSVTEGASVATGTVTISISGLNDDPQIGVIPALEAIEAATTEVSVSAVDPEAGELTFSLDGPSFASLTQTGDTATLTMSPAVGDEGEYTVVIAVQDGDGGVSELTETLTVSRMEGPSSARVSAVSASGVVLTDESSGETTILMPRGEPSDLTIVSEAACPADARVSNVNLLMGEVRYAMVQEPYSATNFVATIPALELTNAEISIETVCADGTVSQEQIGSVILFDPSGVVTDAWTGDPLPGATVTLYKVPGWLPGPGGPATNECQSGSGPWVQPAPVELGVKVDPTGSEADGGNPEIEPDINPLTTNNAGRYGWDVAEGCWYVVVAADGYITRTSSVVGVPPEVTTLDLALTKTPTETSLTIVKTVLGDAAPTSFTFTVEPEVAGCAVAQDVAVDGPGGSIAVLVTDVATGTAQPCTYKVSEAPVLGYTAASSTEGGLAPTATVSFTSTQDPPPVTVVPDPTATATVVPDVTVVPSATAVADPTATATVVPDVTVVPSATAVADPTATATVVPDVTVVPSVTVVADPTATATVVPDVTVVPSVTVVADPTATATVVPDVTVVPSVTVVADPTATATVVPDVTVVPSVTVVADPTATATVVPDVTVVPSVTVVADPTATATVVPDVTVVPSVAPTLVPIAAAGPVAVSSATCGTATPTDTDNDGIPDTCVLRAVVCGAEFTGVDTNADGMPDSCVGLDVECPMGFEARDTNGNGITDLCESSAVATPTSEPGPSDARLPLTPSIALSGASHGLPIGLALMAIGLGLLLVAARMQQSRGATGSRAER